MIDESYNANPASMAAALTLLGNAPGRRVAVLGDMLEMGPELPPTMPVWPGPSVPPAPISSSCADR